MQIYNFSEEGVFLNTSVADRSPLDVEEVWLIPANATTVKPPEVTSSEQAVFSKESGQWTVVPLGQATNPGAEQDAALNALLQKKLARWQAVNAIVVVTASGNSFDGNEDAQNRMARAILGLAPGETIPWVLADNTVASISVDELREALRLAGAAQTALWNIYS